jgi:hypothetical protein
VPVATAYKMPLDYLRAGVSHEGAYRRDMAQVGVSEKP